MRILHLVGRSHRRGAELVATELSEALVPLGHESRMLAVGPGHEGGREPSIPTLTGAVRQHPGALVAAARGLRSDLRRDPVDVVLAHGGAALQSVVLAGGGRPAVPVVYQLIMGMPLDDRGALWHRWWGWLLNRSAAIVSLTEPLTGEVRDLGYRGHVELIPNARSSARFRAIDRVVAGKALRHELGVDDSTPLIGFVGHLVPQKRPDVAVEVLAGVRAAGIDAHLVLVGGGPGHDALCHQVARLGVADHVSLLGHRPDVEAILGGLDVFLLTSDGEGMPGVVIEAQMAGCPVVTFPVGGVDDVLENGATGLVLADHDPAAMAAAVADLVADAGRTARMGAAARVRSELFSMERAAVSYDAVLRSAASG